MSDCILSFFLFHHSLRRKVVHVVVVIVEQRYLNLKVIKSMYIILMPNLPSPFPKPGQISSCISFTPRAKVVETPCCFLGKTRRERERERDDKSKCSSKIFRRPCERREGGLFAAAAPVYLLYTHFSQELYKIFVNENYEALHPVARTHSTKSSRYNVDSQSAQHLGTRVYVL